MDRYLQLLLHLRTISMNKAIYNRAGRLHLKYHADQLMQIQRYAITRSDMLLKTYVYLREASAKNFTSIKFLNILTCPTRIDNLLDPHNPAKTYDCDYCHGDFHHLVLCPFSSFLDSRPKTHRASRVGLLRKFRKSRCVTWLTL
jgi:hypothetical protein